MKLLLVGPSRRINDYNAEYFAKKKSDGYKVVSYGASARYLRDIGIKPDIFSFLDPMTIVSLGVYRTTSMMHSELLIADLFVNNWRKFGECGYTSKTVKANFKLIDFDRIFFKVYEYPATCIRTDSAGENNFAENCCIYSSFGKMNTDKLTCYLLPLVLYHFKSDIEEIRIVGFGDFDVGRTDLHAVHGSAKGNTTGYAEYKQSFAGMIGIYIDYCREQDIDIVFEDDNYYSRTMKKLAH